MMMEQFHNKFPDIAEKETRCVIITDDNSLKDSDIIEALKNIRSNIFSEDAKCNDLEKDIIKKIKLVLSINHYDRRDLLLSISSVLKSAKLHRSVSGSMGYLNFIPDFLWYIKYEFYFFSFVCSIVCMNVANICVAPV